METTDQKAPAELGTVLAEQGTLLQRKFDGKSRTWFWRLRRDKALGFPDPIIIGGQPFWDVSEVDAWIEARKGA